MDNLKLAVAALVVAGGIFAFYWFEEQYILPIRVIALVVMVLAALFVVYQTEMGRAAWGVISEARTEVRKVVFPTGKETVQTTAVVFAVVFLVAVFLWALDSMLLWSVKLLTGQGG